MISALRWRLHSLADYFQMHGCWRTANTIDRLALLIYRLEKRL